MRQGKGETRTQSDSHSDTEKENREIEETKTQRVTGSDRENERAQKEGKERQEETVARRKKQRAREGERRDGRTTQGAIIIRACEG